MFDVTNFFVRISSRIQTLYARVRRIMRGLLVSSSFRQNLREPFYRVRRFKVRLKREGDWKKNMYVHVRKASVFSLWLAMYRDLYTVVTVHVLREVRRGGKKNTYLGFARRVPHKILCSSYAVPSWRAIILPNYYSFPSFCPFCFHYSLCFLFLRFVFFCSLCFFIIFFCISTYILV